MLKSSKVTFRTFSGDTEDVDLAIWLKYVQLAQIKYTEGGYHKKILER